MWVESGMMWCHSKVQVKSEKLGYQIRTITYRSIKFKIQNKLIITLQTLFLFVYPNVNFHYDTPNQKTMYILYGQVLFRNINASRCLST